MIGYYRDKQGGFVRIGPRVIVWTCGKPMFSERNGFRVPFMRIGKWRLFWEE